MTEFPETRMTLLASIKASDDRPAWEEFVDIYRPLIYRMARRRGMQDADAQDVTQVILAQVSSAIDRFESQPGIRFRHWLKRVSRNAILTALTRTWPDVGAGGSSAQDILVEPAEAAAELDDELSHELMREQYLRAAAVVRTEVNAETWLAFELTTIQGISCQDAALSIGKSIGTVYAARSRVIKRLRDQLERMKVDDSH